MAAPDNNPITSSRVGWRTGIVTFGFSILVSGCSSTGMFSKSATPMVYPRLPVAETDRSSSPATARQPRVSHRAQSAAIPHRYKKYHFTAPPAAISDSELSPPEGNRLIGYKYEPKPGNNNADITLPEAILDLNPITVDEPPAATEGFRIVPDSMAADQSDDVVYKAGNRYTVRPGETLMQISRKLYGRESAWRRIFDANRSVLRDPNILKPGMILTIP